jgi:hypothetical protein
VRIGEEKNAQHRTTVRHSTRRRSGQVCSSIVFYVWWRIRAAVALNAFFVFSAASRSGDS